MIDKQREGNFWCIKNNVINCWNQYKLASCQPRDSAFSDGPRAFMLLLFQQQNLRAWAAVRGWSHINRFPFHLVCWFNSRWRQLKSRFCSSSSLGDPSSLCLTSLAKITRVERFRKCYSLKNENRKLFRFSFVCWPKDEVERETFQKRLSPLCSLHVLPSLQNRERENEEKNPDGKCH